MTRRERIIIPYAFVLPALVLLFVFRLYPIVTTLSESLYRTSLQMGGQRVYVGLDNFEHIFYHDPVFWTSLKTTVLFGAFTNPFQVIAAFLFAVLANQTVRGISIFRSIFLLPVSVSVVVSASIWGLMLDQSGVINSILTSINLPRQPFLTDKDIALWSVIGVASWRGVPYWMLFFLAGLQGIPKSVLEAASIDGANSWQILTRVKLPMLKQTVVFVLVADTVLNFILFEPIYLLTQGGPQQSTNLAMYEAFRRGFVYGDLHTSSAIMTVLLVIVSVVVLAEFALMRND